MKISEIFRPMISFFQSKNHISPPAKRSFGEVFSYKIGEPDDEETREAFKRLRERKREFEAEKGKIDCSKSEDESKQGM